jgi:hypothetical protein
MERGAYGGAGPVAVLGRGPAAVAAIRRFQLRAGKVRQNLTQMVVCCHRQQCQAWVHEVVLVVNKKRALRMDIGGNKKQSSGSTTRPQPRDD